MIIKEEYDRKGSTTVTTLIPQLQKISEIPRVFQLQIGRKDSRVSKQLKEKVMLIGPYETCKD